MQKNGLSVNCKSLEIQCLSGQVLDSQIKQLCGRFGQIASFEEKNGIYYVSFAHSYEAMIAKETLEAITVEDIGFQLKVDWIRDKEIESAFEITQTPSVFFPILKKGQSVKSDPPESLKYIAKFPISLSEAENFHLKEKLLGAKGCNFRKIIEHCTKDPVNYEKAKDLIKIKLIEEPELTIKISSRYYQKFLIASGLVYELVTVVLEEYKRFCEIQGINPTDLRIRKIEQVKGRSRTFRERKGDKEVYDITKMQNKNK